MKLHLESVYVRCYLLNKLALCAKVFDIFRAKVKWHVMCPKRTVYGLKKARMLRSLCVPILPKQYYRELTIFLWLLPCSRP